MRLNKLWILLSFMLMLSMTMMYGQDAKNKTTLSLKAVFMDYKALNGGNVSNFRKLHKGIELGLGRYLSNNISVHIPLKLGVVQSHALTFTENSFNKTILSADILGRYTIKKDKAKILPYAFGGAGFVLEDKGKNNLQIPVGLGVQFKVHDRASIDIQAEYRKSIEKERDNLQYSLGFTYWIGKGTNTIKKKEEKKKEEAEPEKKNMKDSDGDGVANDIDLCPQEFGKKEFNGCPDTDGDGIADYKDLCPNIKGTKDLRGCPDSDGDGISDSDDDCPNMFGTIETKGCPTNDSDADGVNNDKDRCPNIPGSKENFGCPDIDTDGDGVPDAIDKCPRIKGPKTTLGCPDLDGDGLDDSKDKCPSSPGLPEHLGCPDTDGDGVPDNKDRCPEIKGNSKTGCPEIETSDKKVLETAMRSIVFESSKDVLKSESYSTLDQIAVLLKKYDTYNLVISGHTDSDGDAQKNQKLSEDRAAACQKYLVTKGVLSTRLRYAGYGESKPIANNATSEGKRLNRRVEFTLIPR